MFNFPTRMFIDYCSKDFLILLILLLFWFYLMNFQTLEIEGKIVVLDWAKQVQGQDFWFRKW